jgi:hypothetical protein
LSSGDALPNSLFFSFMVCVVGVWGRVSAVSRHGQQDVPNDPRRTNFPAADRCPCACKSRRSVFGSARRPILQPYHPVGNALRGVPSGGNSPCIVPLPERHGADCYSFGCREVTTRGLRFWRTATGSTQQLIPCELGYPKHTELPLQTVFPCRKRGRNCSSAITCHGTRVSRRRWS